MRKLPLLAVAAIGLTLGLASIAGAGGSIPTTVKFRENVKTPDPNVSKFRGSVRSPKAKCENHRKLVFATRPQHSDGAYNKIGSTKTDGNAKWAKKINVAESPDIRIKAPAKTFGSPPRRCAPDTLLLSKG